MPQRAERIKQETYKIGAGLCIDEQHGSRDIGGKGHIVHIADTKKPLDIRIMRMFAQGIKEEKDGVHASFRHQRRNLRIAAVGTRKHTARVKPRLFPNERARCVGRDQIKIAQPFFMIHHKCDHVRLFPIVGNKRERLSACLFWHFGLFFSASKVWRPTRRDSWDGAPSAPV